MTKEISNPKLKTRIVLADSGFVIGHSFVIRHSSFVISFSLLLAVANLALASASPRFTVDPPWTTQKGLPESSVFSVLQTRDGYLWVGTGHGVARFDGIRFNTFDEAAIAELSADKIVGLFEDSRGILWIGTSTTGILLVDRDGKVTRLTQAGTGDAGRLVTACEDPSGSVWFSTANRQVSRYRDGRLEQIVGNCNGLATDSSGFVWIAARDPQGAGGRLIGLGPIPKEPSPALQVTYEIPFGKLDFLLGSKAGGYWRLANNHVQKCKLDQVERDFGEYPWRAQVLCACEDSYGNLIIGTYGDGVYYLDGEGKFNYLPDLPSSYILSLCMDREGSLWVGTDARGLNRVRRQMFKVLDSSVGLAITSVCDDRQEGLWFGVNNGGVNHWKDGVLQSFGKAQNLEDPYVRAVLTDSQSNVWVGTLNHGLFQLQNTNMHVVDTNSLGFSAVSVLYEDRQHRVWFGTDRGLVCRAPEKIFTVRNGLSANMIQALADDPAGNLWIGTPAGLDRLTGDQVRGFHKTNGLQNENVSALYADSENILWLGTSSGLIRFDGTNWTRYSGENGLIGNPIGYIAEDPLHYLWLGSLGGLVRVSKTDLNKFAQGLIQIVASRTYGIEDGLPNSQCSAGSQPATAVQPDGTFWFPTIQGLVSVHPEQIHPNTNPPPVRIEAIRLQGDLQTANTLRAAPPSALRIKPGQEGLEIEYTSLNLAAPERARFRHRLALVGHDTTTPWRDAGNVRVAQYPNLPPGNYRFQVTACNEDGLWNPTGSSLAVTVLPPFWRTWWFVTIVTLFLLGLIVSSVHYASTQRLQRQVALLRQQEVLEKERARIARDLHDQLGANLTQVALLGEMVEEDKNLPDEVEDHAKQISSTARETTHALDEIVWTVNPSNDTLDGLVNYLCKYAQEYFALAGLRYRLEVPSDLPSLPISPELRHNLFLASKEAINNVVKHAQASSAWLRLQLEPERFIIEIEDNGRGLAKDDDKKGRSGLRNMRKRMEDVGGKFEASPGAEGGTRVRFIAPVQRQSSDKIPRQ